MFAIDPRLLLTQQLAQTLTDILTENEYRFTDIYQMLNINPTAETLVLAGDTAALVIIASGTGAPAPSEDAGVSVPNKKNTRKKSAPKITTPKGGGRTELESEPCEFCGKPIKHMQVHLKTCKSNPDNQ